MFLQSFFEASRRDDKLPSMNVEKLKYIIWAKDLERATTFYTDVFDAQTLKASETMVDLSVGGGLIGIHSGGEGKRTWTGMSFQVSDLHGACQLLEQAGGIIIRPPVDTPEEPAHLAMCADTEGNEIMLTKQRGKA